MRRRRFTIFSRRGEQFSLSLEMPSDQEGAEENLERMWRAQTGQNCGFELQTVSQAICTVERQRTQESDRNDNKAGVLNTWRCGKSQVYGQIRFVEAGFGPVHSGYSSGTDGCREQEENQHPTKRLHATSPKCQQGTIPDIGCQRGFWGEWLEIC